MAQVALCIAKRSPLASFILPVLFCHGAPPFPACSDWPRFAWSRPPWESHGGDAGCTGARWRKCGSTRWLWRDGPRNGDGHRSDCTFHGDDGAGNGNGTYADNDHNGGTDDDRYANNGGARNDNNGRAHDGCNAHDASNDHNGGASDGGAGNDVLRPRDGIVRWSTYASTIGVVRCSSPGHDDHGRANHARHEHHGGAGNGDGIFRRSASNARNDYNGCTDHGRNASDASVWRRIIRRSTSHARNGCTDHGRDASDAILWRRVIRGRTTSHARNG